MTKSKESKTDLGVKFFTPWNYQQGAHSCEPENTAPSETIPDQSYTVKELLNLHARGINISVLKQGLWEEDDFGDEQNPLRKQNFDLSDIDDIRHDLEQQQQEVHNQRKEREKQAHITRKRKIIEEYVQEQQQQQKIQQQKPLTDKQILSDVVKTAK